VNFKGYDYFEPLQTRTDFSVAFLIRHKCVVKAHATKHDGKLFCKIARARTFCIESIIIISERQVEGDRKYRIIDFY